MGFPSTPQGPPPGGPVPPYGGPPSGPPTGPPPGPAGPYQPPPGGGGGSWFDSNRNWFLPTTGIVLVLVLLGGYLAFSGDEASADEIFLEPVDFAGEDPFTESTATGDATATARAVADLDSQVTGSVDGSEPGLYGGTLNQSVCDREQLVDFLGENADKARAFAGVLNIDVDEIPEYVASLTAVILRGDTRVTNHGFSNGEAVPLQSVLQAGTAVLVDTEGIPRVKCYCGNPLTEPIEARSPRYAGDPWDNWDPADVQVTFVDVTINIFVITDIDTGDTFELPPGSDGDDGTPDGGGPPSTTVPPDTTLPPSTTAPLGTGDVQLTLRWNAEVDLDLHVIDPSGAEIFYGARTSPSGGQLDTDAQSGCAGTGSCVENIFWPVGGAPPGEYQVFVVNFSGSSAADYTVDINVGGEVIDTLSGSVESTTETTTFTVS